MNSSQITLVGAYGSPYSMKMRAVLRYRHIAHRWIVRNSSQDRGLPEPPVAIIPVLVFHGEDGGRTEISVRKRSRSGVIGPCRILCRRVEDVGGSLEGFLGVARPPRSGGAGSGRVFPLILGWNRKAQAGKAAGSDRLCRLLLMEISASWVTSRAISALSCPPRRRIA